MEKRIEKWESLRLEAQKFTPQEFVAGCGSGSGGQETYVLNNPTVPYREKLHGWNGTCMTANITPPNTHFDIMPDAAEELLRKISENELTEWLLYDCTGNSADDPDDCNIIPGYTGYYFILKGNITLSSPITLSQVENMHNGDCSSGHVNAILVLDKNKVINPMS